MAFGHGLIGCSAAGFAEQSRMCTVSYGTWLHKGQLSEGPEIILNWVKIVLVTLGSRLSYQKPVEGADLLLCCCQAGSGCRDR